MRKTKYTILESSFIKLTIGAFILGFWCALESPKCIMNQKNLPNSLDDPNLVIFINFASWLALISAITFIVIAVAGFIRWTINKKS